MSKKWFGLLVLVLVFSSIAVIPAAAEKKAKSHPDKITFVKLSDIEFVDKSGQGITMKKSWMKNLLKVEWGYGKYTNATLVWDGKRLTIYLQDDVKHDGRWFALNEQILKKVGIDPDKVSVKLDTKAPAEVVKRLKADGKWFYFYIDHFTVRYVTFEASEGYVEYSDWGWQNYTKLIEPDPYCEDCAVFAPLDDLVDNGDGTGNTTIYVNGEAQIATVYFNETTGYPKLVSGVVGNALEFDGNSNEYVEYSSITLGERWSIAFDWIPDQDYLVGGSYPSIAFLDFNKGNTMGIIYHGSNNFILLYIDGYTWALTSQAMDFKAGQRYHIVIVWNNADKSDRKIIINGVDVTGTRYDVTFTPATGAFRVGTFKAVVWAKGKIDEVKVWNDKMLHLDDISLMHDLGRYKLPLWQGNEAEMPAYLNATLFCPLDNLDTVNNVTKCYLNKEEVNATVYFNESTGYPRLVSGWIKNAFEFDGNTGEAIAFDSFSINENITQLTLFASFNATAFPSNRIALIQWWENMFGLYIGPNGQSLIFTMKDAPGLSGGVEKTVAADYTFEVGKEYKVAGVFNKTHVMLYVNGELIYTANAPYSTIPAGSGQLSIGSFWKGQNSVISGRVDEARIYINRALSNDEIALLSNINRHKTAVLSAPSATFDGSQFLVNISASLPNDGKSYILPAPKDAQANYSSVGTIGNFTFLDVGTASSATFTLPVPSDLSPPAGISLLAWLYNDELYITGQADQFPVIATVMNLPKGVWDLEGGNVELNQIMTNYTKLIIANVSAPAVVRRIPAFYVNPELNYVNLTVLQYSKQKIEMNASAEAGEKVTFTIGNLYANTYYRIYVDGQEKELLKTNDAGYLTFTIDSWSTHIITVELVPAGEQMFRKYADIVAILVGAFIAIPLSLIGLYVYSAVQAQKTGRMPRINFREIMNLFIIAGLVGMMILMFAIALLYAGGFIG